jgi:hypothetical protein
MEANFVIFRGETISYSLHKTIQNYKRIFMKVVTLPAPSSSMDSNTRINGIIWHHFIGIITQSQEIEMFRTSPPYLIYLRINDTVSSSDKYVASNDSMGNKL